MVLGVDFGSRAVRTALCDLGGGVRAREEIRSRGSVEERIDALASSVRSLLRTSKLPGDLLENAVVALPAVVSPTDGRVSAPDLPGLGASDLREQLERALARAGDARERRQPRGGRRATARSGPGRRGLRLPARRSRPRRAVMLDRKLHRGHNGNAGELDAVRNGRADDVDPCAASLSQLAGELAVGRRRCSSRRSTCRSSSRRPRRRAVGITVIEEAARRIALHVLPLAATLDLPLVVLGGSVGANAALLEPVRRHLDDWLPFPAPRVEVSALGEAAVIEGALAAGVDTAIEHLFQRRARRRAS